MEHETHYFPPFSAGNVTGNFNFAFMIYLLQSEESQKILNSSKATAAAFMQISASRSTKGTATGKKLPSLNVSLLVQKPNVLLRLKQKKAA
jgi:hypothetical protein